MPDSPPDLPGVTHRLEPARDGVRLHVAEAGDPAAPPVVLLHGWPQHWWMWRHLIPLLSSSHRVLAVDLRGFGWSDAPPRGYRKDELAKDVLALLDGLGVQRAAFVGHDWGAVITYILTNAAPERVERAVTMSVPQPWARPGLRDLPALRGFAHMPILSTPLLGERAAGSSAFLGLVERAAGSAWDEGSRRLYVERFTRHPERARAAAQVYRTFLTRELVPGLSVRRPSMPLLALHGADDPVPASLNRDAEVIAGAGHWLAEERPDVVGERIRTFLAA